TFVDDPITGILRQGARKLLAQALESEIKIFISQYRDLTDEMGRQRIVRNGHLPEREIQTGIGAVPVKAPRVRDRHAKASKRMKFRSNILPAYLRKTKSMEQLIPWLYLTGVCPGDFSDALAALVGNGLSATGTWGQGNGVPIPPARIPEGVFYNSCLIVPHINHLQIFFAIYTP
ncbi:MAG: hypothetical protein GY874_00985, partial [Desulfobacteraceae bacterium]|nr:hypothetical protein [Desulfobacteraceae bacterium]